MFSWTKDPEGKMAGLNKVMQNPLFLMGLSMINNKQGVGAGALQGLMMADKFKDAMKDREYKDKMLGYKDRELSNAEKSQAEIERKNRASEDIDWARLSKEERQMIEDMRFKRDSLGQADRHFNATQAQNERFHGDDLGYRYDALKQGDRHFGQEMGQRGAEMDQRDRHFLAEQRFREQSQDDNNFFRAADINLRERGLGIQDKQAEAAMARARQGRGTTWKDPYTDVAVALGKNMGDPTSNIQNADDLAERLEMIKDTFQQLGIGLPPQLQGQQQPQQGTFDQVRQNMAGPGRVNGVMPPSQPTQAPARESFAPQAPPQQPPQQAPRVRIDPAKIQARIDSLRGRVDPTELQAELIYQYGIDPKNFRW